MQVRLEEKAALLAAQALQLEEAYQGALTKCGAPRSATFTAHLWGLHTEFCPGSNYAAESWQCALGL